MDKSKQIKMDLDKVGDIPPPKSEETLEQEKARIMKELNIVFNIAKGDDGIWYEAKTDGTPGEMTAQAKKESLDELYKDDGTERRDLR